MIRCENDEYLFKDFDIINDKSIKKSRHRAVFLQCVQEITFIPGGGFFWLFIKNFDVFYDKK